MDVIAEREPEGITAAKEVGPKVAESVFQFLREPHNQKLIERLRAAACSSNIETTRPKADRSKDLTFVLTGTLPGLSRDEAKNRIEAASGKVTGTVSEKNRLRGGRRGRRIQARQGAETGN